MPDTEARQTFAAMTVEERQNLAKLECWNEPGYKRRLRDYLIGPQYVALRHHGVIAYGELDTRKGAITIITEHGRAVLHFIEGGL